MDVDKDIFSLEMIHKLIWEELRQFHPILNESDPSTYAFPILKDEQLYTLDLDGSLIYIGKEWLIREINYCFEDYKKGKSQFNSVVETNLRPILEETQQKETLEFLGYAREGKTEINHPYKFSEMQIEKQGK